MTELEYERSMWEAQKLEAALEAEGSMQHPEENPQKTEAADDNEKKSTADDNGKKKGTADKEKNQTKRKKAKGDREPKRVPVDVTTLEPKKIEFTPVEDETPQDVPALSYGLDRVLFNPGVYQIQDTRTQVYNFDPYLATIMPVDQFDFDALKQYITSSKDTKLRDMSKKHGAKYCGSTSSMTSMLSHLHYLLSAWRKPDFSHLSKSLDLESTNFTKMTRAPAAAYARLNDGVYAIDADKEFDTENILSTLGKSMEKLLTLPKEDYEKYRHTRSHLITEEQRNADEAYHYTTLGDFMMRSQLDARDPRLPGTGVFDLKTRAVVSIRMDVHGYEEGRGYEIRKRFGQWESFEREYCDLIRAAFLKYSLQVRMGRMDGIFLAYHNTERIFGFQYVSLEEMDQAIHGTQNRQLGDQEFKASVALLNDLMNRATERFPGRSLRLHVETRDTKIPLTYFFVEPVTEEDLQQSQEEAKRSLEAAQEDILSLQEREKERASEETPPESDVSSKQVDETPDEPSSSAPGEGEVAAEAEGETDDQESDHDAWEEMTNQVEDIVESDSQGTVRVAEALRNAIDHLSLLPDATPQERQEAVSKLESALLGDIHTMKEIGGMDGDESARQDVDQEEADTKEEVEETAKSTKEVAETTEGMAESTGQTGVEEDAAADESEEGTTKLMEAMTRAMENVQLRSETPGHELRPFERVVAELAAAASAKRGAVQEQGDATPEEIVSSEDAKTEEVTSDEAPSDETTPDHATTPGEPAEKKPRELMGLYVTVRNKVNDKLVDRPEEPLKGRLSWAVQYAISEIPDNEARRIYSQIRGRRASMLGYEASKSSQPNAWKDKYRERIKDIAKQGERYRQKVEERQKGKDVYVAWDEKPLPPQARYEGIPGKTEDQ